MDPKTVAAKALAKCAAYDPWFPQPNPATVAAWAEQIERHQVTLEQALAGVTKMYEDNGSGFKPLPRDLIRAARAFRTADPETAEELDARNYANDVRLGLDTSWYTGDKNLAMADERRRAIEEFVSQTASVERLELPVAPHRETLAEKVARIRAEGPPAVLPPSEDEKVAERGAGGRDEASW